VLFLPRSDWQRPPLSNDVHIKLHVALRPAISDTARSDGETSLIASGTV